MSEGKSAATPPEKTGHCKDCDAAARHAFSDATTAGFFHSKCARHKAEEKLLLAIMKFAENQSPISELKAAMAEFRNSAEPLGSVAAPKAPPELQGSWPADCVQRAFAEGAAWWQFHANGATMFASEHEEADAEAVRRYGAPKAQPEVNGRRFSWTPATDGMHAHVLYGDGDWAAVVYDNLALEVYADELAKRIADLLNEACAPKAGEPPQGCPRCAEAERLLILLRCEADLKEGCSKEAAVKLGRWLRGAGETPAERPKLKDTHLKALLGAARKEIDPETDWQIFYPDLREAVDVLLVRFASGPLPPGAGSTKDSK